jgi:hypothetical protein
MDTQNQAGTCAPGAMPGAHVHLPQDQPHCHETTKRYMLLRKGCCRCG